MDAQLMESVELLARIFPGDSELARRMRDYDWAATDLGSPTGWPENLRVAIAICLTSKFPMHILWGPSLTLFYNDAYISLLGHQKHPGALGRSGREAWSEIWTTIGPMIDLVRASQRASWSADTLMFLERARRRRTDLRRPVDVRDGRPQLTVERVQVYARRDDRGVTSCD